MRLLGSIAGIAILAAGVAPIDDWHERLLDQIQLAEAEGISKLYWFVDAPSCELCTNRNLKAFTPAEARKEFSQKFCASAGTDSQHCSLEIASERSVTITRILFDPGIFGWAIIVVFSFAVISVPLYVYRRFLAPGRS